MRDAADLHRRAARAHVVHRHHLEHPRRRVLRRARAPRAQHGGRPLEDLGLHEQLAEGRMQHEGHGARQHHLGVAGDLDAALRAAAVGEAHAPQLDVVLGRDRDLQQALDPVRHAVVRGLVGGEARDVAAHLLARGVERGRPDRAAAHVAQVDERAPVVLRDVFPPARDGVAVAT